MKVHPFADRFPMLPKEQLQDLAADISEHGQVYPIMTDSDGVLLDGRNRLAACKLAGVKPKVEVWSGDNPLDYILSVNVHRRHVKRSTVAMAVAIAHPESVKRGPKKKRIINSVNNSNQSLAESLISTASEGVMLSQARAVIREFGVDSEVVSAVMHGGSLIGAYDAVLKRKDERAAQVAYLKKLQEEFDQFDADDLDEYVDVPTPPLTEVSPDVAARIKVLEEQLRVRRAKADEARRLEREAEEEERVRREGEEMLARLQQQMAEMSVESDEIVPAANLIQVPYGPREAATGLVKMDVAKIRSQEKLMQRLGDIRRAIDELVKQPIIDNPYDSKGFINTVRVTVANYINELNKFANSYNVALDKPPIRSVK